MPPTGHNVIQNPELVRRLLTRLGIKQPSLTPTLSDTLQPVVILDDLREAPQNQGARHFYRSFAFNLDAQNNGAATPSGVAAPAPAPVEVRLEIPAGGAVTARLRHLEIILGIADADINLLGEAYLQLGGRYVGTTYPPTFLRALSMAKGDLTPKQEQSQLVYGVGYSVQGVTAPQPSVWRGNPASAYMGPRNAALAVPMTPWKWEEHWENFGPQFGPSVGVSIFASNVAMPNSTACVNVIWAEDPITTEQR